MEEGPSFLEEVANQGVVSYQEGEGAYPSLEHLEEGASVILPKNTHILWHNLKTYLGTLLIETLKIVIAI